VSSITPAASVLLSRGPGSREVFAVRRGTRLKFFGGFWAFPGGRVDPDDGPEDAARIAACRELFEETGVLIARRADGSFPPTDADLERARREVLAGRLPFTQLLAGRRLAIRADDFQPIGQLTTPPFSAARFATNFFTAYLPPGQCAEVWEGELDHGAWVEGEALLAQWVRGECLLTPPTVAILQALAGGPIDAAPHRLGPLFADLAAGAMHPIDFAPQVRLLPLRTVALPPLAYTNAFVVGSGPRYLIDPGPDDPEEQRRLLAALDAYAGPLTAVVLTHHHPDHVGAAAACAARYGIPVWAHELTARRLQGRVDVTRFLGEGDRLDLGPCPADGRPWHLDVLHTPGHAPGHLAFFEPFYRLLFVGDLLSTVTSIVIVPPDGDLAVYLQSLRRLREIPARLLLPAHGNVTARPADAIDEALEHRARREAQLLEALGEGPQAVGTLVPRLYRGLPEVLERLARAQVQSGLRKLQQEGRARPTGDGEERWERIES
jgi:glyoxylase-like metal-dependent hydrolase (beta-lactamase superfamily II)/8-oxo-dGTP pyrophosphatase MutT (NUDIX family)